MRQILSAVLIPLSFTLATREAINPPEKPAPKIEDIAYPEMLTEGWYRLAGMQRKDSYHGMVMIRKLGKNWLVLWTLEAGHTAKGVGLRVGQDQFSVGWVTNKGGVGVTVYTLHSGGRLSGRWAADLDNHRESLTFSHRLAPIKSEDD